MTKWHGDGSKVPYLTEEELEQSVVITDPALPDNPMIFVSEEFLKQTGYSPEDALGKNCRFLQGPKTNPLAVAAIRTALESESELTIDILNYKRDGTEFWNRLRIRPLYGDDAEVLFFVGTQNPIPPEQVRKEPISAIAT